MPSAEIRVAEVLLAGQLVLDRCGERPTPN